METEIKYGKDLRVMIDQFYKWDNIFMALSACLDLILKHQSYK